MNILRIKLIFAFCCFFQFCLAFAEQPTMRNCSIGKIPEDPRDYCAFKLKNGVDVLVVSDVRLNSSAISIAIGTGTSDDPEGYTWLAHLLEHMVLLGMEPNLYKSDWFSKSLEQDRTLQGKTSVNSTHYFSTSPSHLFEEIVTELAQNIKAPKFQHNMVLNPKVSHRIAEEYAEILHRTDYAYLQMLHNMFNSEHPYSKVKYDEIRDFRTYPGDELISELRRYHDYFYTGENVDLVVTGNQSISELEELIRNNFDKISSATTAKKRNTVPPFTKREMQRHLFVKDNSAIKLMSIMIPFKYDSLDASTKGYIYVKNMLLSKANGTLYNRLESENLVESLSIDEITFRSSPENIMDIQFSLTEEGVKRRDDVISMFFDYISLIKSEGVKEDFQYLTDEYVSAYAKEMLQWNALEIARALNEYQPHLPAEFLALLPFYSLGFDSAVAESINVILNDITIDRMQVYYSKSTGIHTGGNVDGKSKYFEYRYFSASEKAKWKNNTIPLLLPPKQLKNNE